MTAATQILTLIRLFKPLGAFRHLRPVLSMLLLVCSTGCESMRHWIAFSRPVPSPSAILPMDASSDEIIAALNDNITQLYAWRSTDVKITAKQHGVPIMLSAMMAVESPRKLRLMATSLAGNEVDLGSNPERFWFWVRRSEPHGIMTASYDDVEEGKPLGPLPFQPEWLIETLGVIPIVGRQFTMQELPARTSEAGRSSSRFVAFVAEHETPQGRRIKRTMVVDVAYAAIVEHSLHEPSGQLIARARLSHYQREPGGPRLPHRIELNWPEAGCDLTIRVGSIEVNPPSVTEQTWSMPSYPDSPVIDLTRFRP